MSKVLLVNPSYNFPVKREMYPNGALLLLGTMAKQRGHDVKIVHMVADDQSVGSVVMLARNFMTDIIGITVNTFQVAATKKLLSELRWWSVKSRIVIGGAHPSSVGINEARREFPEADDIICGEGEHQFMSILDNETAQKPQDLEYVAPPDLSLVDLSKFTGAYPLGECPAMFLMASRGCPGQCTFCNRSIFGNKVRYRSPENVLRELRHFAKNGIKEVFIQDDTFNLNRAWYEEILQRIISEGLNKKMVFRAPFRADEQLVNEKVLRLAKQAGFWLLFYGVESGNQGMLDRMHKNLKLGEIGRAVELTKEARIKVETSFIVGLPGETLQTIEDTSNFYDRLAPFWSGCGIAIPFPSTAISQEVHDQVKDIPYEEYRPGRVYFRTDELDSNAIAVNHEQLERAMLQDKLTNMVGHPKMLLRTIRDRVR